MEIVIEIDKDREINRRTDTLGNIEKPRTTANIKIKIRTTNQIKIKCRHIYIRRIINKQIYDDSETLIPINLYHSISL